MRKKSPRTHDYLVLTPTEESVVRFLASQERGASISQTARAVRLARTSIYNAIHALIKKKLAVKEGFTYTLTNNKWKPYKESVKNPKEHIQELMYEMLRLKRGEIIYSIESNEEIQELFKSRKEFFNWQRTVTEKGIVLKGIGTKNALAFFQSMLDDDLHNIMKKRSGSPRLTNDVITGPCTLVSFHDSVIFFSRKKNFFYRVDDSRVAQFSQSVINLLYGALEHQPIVTG